MFGLSARTRLLLAAGLLGFGLLKLADWAVELLWFDALGYAADLLSGTARESPFGPRQGGTRDPRSVLFFAPRTAPTRDFFKVFR